MRSVEDTQPRNAPLRRIGRFLARPVNALSRRKRVQKRRSAEACAASTPSADSPQLAHMQYEDVRAPLLGVSKGIEDFTNAVSAFLSTTVSGFAIDTSQGGFPAQMTPHNRQGTIPGADKQQSLTATGSKQWGSWFDGGGLLRFKIYDFALYTNSRQLTAIAPYLAPATRQASEPPNPLSPASNLPGLSPLSPVPVATNPMFPLASVDNAQADPSPEAETPARRIRLRPRLPLRRPRSRSGSGSEALITDRVRAATPQVEMSLYVRPARDIPLMLLRNEYSRILRKRMKAVGGSSSDTALHTMLSYFNPERLPAGSTRRGCIRKGTNMVFSRSKSGNLTTTADGALVATVQSPKLCEAVFDLYLGDAPVCKKARDTAKEKYEDIVSSSNPLSLRM